MPDSVVHLLESATRRLVRSVDAMTDDQFAEPSLLPGWTRGHVVAHLTLNAEGLAGALEGVHEGRGRCRCTPPRRRATATSRSCPAWRRAPCASGSWPRPRSSTTPSPSCPRSSHCRPDRADARQRPGLHGRPGRRDAAARGRDPPRRPRSRLHVRGLAGRASPTCSWSPRTRVHDEAPFVAARRRPRPDLRVRRRRRSHGHRPRDRSGMVGDGPGPRRRPQPATTARYRLRRRGEHGGDTATPARSRSAAAPTSASSST